MADHRGSRGAFPGDADSVVLVVASTMGCFLSSPGHPNVEPQWLKTARHSLADSDCEVTREQSGPPQIVNLLPQPPALLGVVGVVHSGLLLGVSAAQSPQLPRREGRSQAAVGLLCIQTMAPSSPSHPWIAHLPHVSSTAAPQVMATCPNQPLRPCSPALP